MADKYISAEQAYSYLRSVLYETTTNNVGINDDFAAECEEIADNRLKVWLDDIPAADVQEVRQGKWIPVEERLPNEFQLVYASCECEGGEPWVIDCMYATAYTTIYRGSPWGNVPILTTGEAKVVAWMPKRYPEPYVKKS